MGRHARHGRPDRRYRSRVVRLAFVIGLLGGSSALDVAATTAVPGAPDALVRVYDREVHGDFITIGNAVLQCPPRTPACRDEMAATGNPSEWKGNHAYLMRHADVDGADNPTFDSASASFTLPEGTVVDTARLSWAGNTGRYWLPDRPAGIPACGARSFGTPQRPATRPPGRPQAVPVVVTVDERQPALKAPQEFASTGRPPGGGAEYYSARADVTELFEGVPTGRALAITVGNVWTPEGYGCFGGWALTVVYRYDEPRDAPTGSRHRVTIEEGHLAQLDIDATASFQLTDLPPVHTPGIRLGLVAYEGDRSLTGDRLLVGGVPVREPATGAADNQFLSYAEGQLAPKAPNNFSVDAKAATLGPLSLAPGLRLDFETHDDAYLLQQVTVSVPLPDLRLAVSAPAVARPGDPVTYAIRVSAPTRVPAEDVTVRAPGARSCERTIAMLPADQTLAYTCVDEAGANAGRYLHRRTFTASATAGGLPVRATQDTDIALAAIALQVAPQPDRIAAGSPVSFQVEVTNPGRADLREVAVRVPQAPACARRWPALAAGASVAYACEVRVRVEDPAAQTFTRSFTVSARPEVPDGHAAVGPVSATAKARVAILDSGLAVKVAVPTPVRGDRPAVATVTVRNTGEVPLRQIRITLRSQPECARELSAALPPGAAASHECPIIPSGDQLQVSATARAREPAGSPLAVTGQTRAVVVNPAAAIAITANQPWVRRGQEAGFTITVRNTGDVDLAWLSVRDKAFPGCARPRLGPLEAGASLRYVCRAPLPPTLSRHVQHDVTIRGASRAGHVVTASDAVRLEVAAPRRQGERKPDEDRPISPTLKVVIIVAIAVAAIVVARGRPGLRG